MQELVRFQLEQGGEVLVEQDQAAFGVQRAGRDQRQVIQANKTLEAALRTIRPAAQAVLDALKDLAPAEKRIEFGVKLNAEAGALIAKAGAECHFHVALTWRA